MKHLISGLIKFSAASILVVSLVACGGAEERKAKYLEKGKAYLAEKNYEKARIEFKNVLQIDPKYPDAYFLMGQLEERNKELGKALGNYKKAMELNPKFTEAKVKLAKIYVIAGTTDFIDQAKKLLAEVKQEQPENTEAKLIMATIEYKSGSKSQATKELEAVVNEDKNLVEGISLLSTIYQADGKESKALKLLKQGALDNPENIPLRITLAQLLAKNKDYVGAEKYLKQAQQIEPEKYSLQVALASFFATSNQLDKAESVLRDAIKQDEDDAQRYLVLVEMLSTRRSIKEGEEELEKAIKKKPDLYELKFAQVKFYEKTGRRDKAKSVLKQIILDKSYDVEGVRARTQLAQMLLDEGDQDGARKYVEEVTAEYPNNNDALLITSKLALINLDAVSAINSLRTVVKNDPKNPEASLLLAQAHELNKESSLAEDVLKRAIEANPLNPEVHANYAQYLGSKGRIDEALNVVDKALAYFKDNYDLMNIKLRIMVSQGKESEILPILNMMEQVSPLKAEVNITKGEYYLAKRKIPEAVEQFKKAASKSRDKFKPLQLIVKAYISNKQPEKALEVLQSILDKTPEDPVANLLTGQVFLAQKKLEEAKAKFKQAIKAADQWFVPYTTLASTYLSQKQPEKAIEVYQQALSKMDNKTPARLQLAGIYEQQKNYSKAMKIYEAILNDNPGNKLAANNYASLLLDFGSQADVKKALELSRAFEKLNQPALLDTLGWAYAKSGDNQKAIEILKPVVDKAPKVAVFRYHLGYALFKAGDKAAAKSHLQIAVDSQQEFTGKDKAEEILKTI